MQTSRADSGFFCIYTSTPTFKLGYDLVHAYAVLCFSNQHTLASLHGFVFISLLCMSRVIGVEGRDAFEKHGVACVCIVGVDDLFPAKLDMVALE